MIFKILNWVIFLLLRIKNKFFIDYTWKDKYKKIEDCKLVNIESSKSAIDYYKKITEKFRGPEDVELYGRHTILPTLISNLSKDSLNILDFGGSSNPAISYLIKTCKQNFLSTVIETKFFVEKFQNKIPAEYKDILQYKDSFKDLNFDLYDICHFGGAIQYIENYEEILKRVFQSKIKYIVITETFFNYTDQDFFVLAIKDNPQYLANRFFSYDKFMKLFKENNFKCIFENKRTSENHRHKTINFSEYSIFDLVFKRN